MRHRGAGVSFHFGCVAEDASICARRFARNLLCRAMRVACTGGTTNGLAVPGKTAAEKSHHEKENQGKTWCCHGALKSPSHAKRACLTVYLLVQAIGLIRDPRKWA